MTNFNRSFSVQYYCSAYIHISNIKSLRLRKSLPQMLAAWKVIRSESGAPIITLILLNGGFV